MNRRRILSFLGLAPLAALLLPRSSVATAATDDGYAPRVTTLFPGERINAALFKMVRYPEPRPQWWHDNGVTMAASGDKISALAELPHNWRPVSCEMSYSFERDFLRVRYRKVSDFDDVGAAGLGVRLISAHILRSGGEAAVKRKVKAALKEIGAFQTQGERSLAEAMGVDLDRYNLFIAMTADHFRRQLINTRSLGKYSMDLTGGVEDGQLTSLICEHVLIYGAT